ncbi:hypothetical protein [Levilactobacillus acidifarinae]|uniref:ASCH domain-containing protein n=1 Tax=Levilactobacillus acidifarinae DSM 19394 = JCM 15949 TaxID=1423715 RepID=A0A0R1LJV5_9LACO|nr:hypothetical protein [Levilactobacillus acidifarinae]KRK96095.1 hypothetical protein FD25_GL002558 [Levilactobacillus acidifarinae DSM 19394]GEO69631.1 hypothetical protein LAC03_15410 [Levilactobacillus acidifarinae]
MTQSITTIYDDQLPTLLLALHPDATTAVLSGHKILEFRKRFFPRPFQAFVYTTGRGIQFFMRCGAAYQGPAATVAKLGTLVQHSNFAATMHYLGAGSTGIAVPIQATYRLTTTVTLADLRAVAPQVAVPQTYTFLDQPQRAELLTYLTQQSYDLHHQVDWHRRQPMVDALFS